MKKSVIENIVKTKTLVGQNSDIATTNVQRFIKINKLDIKRLLSIVPLQSYTKIREVYNGATPNYLTIASIANYLKMDALAFYKGDIKEELLTISDLNYPVTINFTVRDYFIFTNTEFCDFVLHVREKYYPKLSALFISTFVLSGAMPKIIEKKKIPVSTFFKIVVLLGMYSEENYDFFCAELEEAGLSHCIIKKPEKKTVASVNSLEVRECFAEESYILNSRCTEEDSSTTITNSNESLELYNLICNIPNFQNIMQTKCSKSPTSYFQGEGFYYIRNKATNKVFYAGINLTNMGDYILHTGEYVGMKPTIVNTDEIEILAKIDKISFS